jgi:hypothetical protein
MANSFSKFGFNKTKLIQCPCNNNIIVYAHTEKDGKSSSDFTTVIEVTGCANLDHNHTVLCVCGKVHSIKRFVNGFVLKAKSLANDEISV